MKKEQIAESLFLNDFNCAQSVLSTFSNELGLDQEIALKITTPFGGGIVNLGKTCGAVTGALMAIGLKYGRSTSDDLFAKENTAQLSNEFIEKFSSLHGTIECSNLLQCDIATDKGKAHAINNDLFNSLCPKYVKDAVLLLEEIL